jgi:pantoate--beta-alanine ligase
MSDNSDILILRTVSEFRNWRKNVVGSVGFIPTMGYLHEGHRSLIDLARVQNDHVVVSIFVNPKQFGPNEDFNMYPRNEKYDLQLLQQAQVDIAFLPEVSEMYPPDFETHVSVLNLSRKLEGEKRPGHFDGVATVITKFFNIIQPDLVYFGQKDAQQVLIIKKMVKDLQFPVSIIVGETIREKDGLALSSRNIFLRKKEKEESIVLSQSLDLAQRLVMQGERNPEKIKKEMRELIKKTAGKIDYISIADIETLEELKMISKKILVSLAVYYGKTRLIDNCIFII